MSKRYIDAGKIVITAERGISDNGLIFIPMSDVHQSIERTPTADVAEVRRGEWIDEDFPERKVTINSVAICSICHEMALKTEHGYSILSHYCPNCGAKMDGGNKG